MESTITLNRARITMYALCILMLVLLGVRIYVGKTLDTKGIALAAEEEKIQQYKDENEYLREQILQAEALTTIQDKAKANGFVPAEYYQL